ncbi:hypothetical protein ACEPAH_8839 [Sanghuangporus vaninii]
MSKYAPHKPSANSPRATPQTLCQRCLKKGHFTYQCKNERPYVSRPSRTQLLNNPKLLAKVKPEVEVPDEFKNKSGMANKILEAKEKERAVTKAIESKKRKRSDSESESSSTSDSDSDSNSSSSSSRSSDSGSSRSRSRSISSVSSSHSRSRRYRSSKRRRSPSRSSRSRSYTSEDDRSRSR